MRKREDESVVSFWKAECSSAEAVAERSKQLIEGCDEGGDELGKRNLLFRTAWWAGLVRHQVLRSELGGPGVEDGRGGGELGVVYVAPDGCGR